MFEKYFVTCRVAVALRGAGFDEPCMGCHQTDHAKTQSKLFYTEDPDKPFYNGQLASIFHYAAPLYQQVFEWLWSKGLHLHDYFMAADIIRKDHDVWGCSVYHTKTGKLLWPEFNLSERVEYHTKEPRQAWEQAILAAIKLLTNEPKMDV